MIVMNETYIEARSCDVKISSSNQTSHRFLRESLKKAHSFFHTITLVGSLWKQNSKTAAIYCQHVQIVALHVQQAIRLNRLKCTVYSNYFISSNHSCESSCSQVTISGTSRWIYKWQVKALQWNCMQDFNIQQKVIRHVFVCALLCCYVGGLTLSIKTLFTFCPKIPKASKAPKVWKLDILIQDLGLHGVLGSSRNSHFRGAHHIKGAQHVSQDQPQGFRTHRHLQLFCASGFMSFWSFFWSCFVQFLPFTVKKLGLLEEPSDP